MARFQEPFRPTSADLFLAASKSASVIPLSYCEQLHLNWLVLSLFLVFKDIFALGILENFLNQQRISNSLISLACVPVDIKLKFDNTTHDTRSCI